MIDGGGKRIVRPSKNQEFWKYIGYVLSEVTHGKKGKNLCSEIIKSVGSKSPTKLQIDVHGNNDLYKVCCENYRIFEYMLANDFFFSHKFFISWIFL